MTLLYEAYFWKLRQIAARLLSRERLGHTLQPTALVVEAFLKLRGMATEPKDRSHFFGLHVRAMKQVLIDHARVREVRTRLKPEFARHQESMNTSGGDPDRGIAVRFAFERLEQKDPQAASLIWSHLVEGFTLEETARRFGLPRWRTIAEIQFGLNWMADQFHSLPALR